MAERAIAELGGVRDLRVETPRPEPGESAVNRGGGATITLPTYENGAKVATRQRLRRRAAGARRPPRRRRHRR